MEILNQLLTIDPNHIVIGLIVVFFSLEMAIIRPIDFKGKFNFIEKILFNKSIILKPLADIGSNV